jgi:hypothetical protein
MKISGIIALVLIPLAWVVYGGLILRDYIAYPAYRVNISLEIGYGCILLIPVSIILAVLGYNLLAEASNRAKRKMLISEAQPEQISENS